MCFSNSRGAIKSTESFCSVLSALIRPSRLKNYTFLKNYLFKMSVVKIVFFLFINKSTGTFCNAEKAHKRSAKALTIS